LVVENAQFEKADIMHRDHSVRATTDGHVLDSRIRREGLSFQSGLRQHVAVLDTQALSIWSRRLRAYMAAYHEQSRGCVGPDID
jgi:hypothetical protein